ncbi:hypothetical protein PIROE2DRAFT_64005 [Piromyces sp. E2]|nr:hypothetical protein PIROE2DRAFT_64005 [Piromyces sp. E2]|eukprot:OUM59080.1 hypothetical protein PIROE2DRAFT_64005 [Piromyces sp. E2]
MNIEQKLMQIEIQRNLNILYYCGKVNRKEILWKKNVPPPILPRENIGIFGCMNAGKSTLMNLLTQQATSIVDDKPGTTADVKVALMEIHNIGPCKLFDTAGYDEEGKLGQKKLHKTHNIVKESDLVIIVIDKQAGSDEINENEVIKIAKKRQKNVVIIQNVRGKYI